MQVKLQLLEERVTNLEDWIVIADSDEFHNYTGDDEALAVGLGGAGPFVQRTGLEAPPVVCSLLCIGKCEVSSAHWTRQSPNCPSRCSPDVKPMLL